MEEQSVHLEIDSPTSRELNRWLPLVKWLLAIPHYVVLMFLGSARLFAIVVAWFAILITGRYPRPLFDYVVGVGRWTLRVNAYAWLLVTDVPTVQPAVVSMREPVGPQAAGSAWLGTSCISQVLPSGSANERVRAVVAAVGVDTRRLTLGTEMEDLADLDAALGVGAVGRLDVGHDEVRVAVRPRLGLRRSPCRT